MSEQFCGLAPDGLRMRYGAFYAVRVGSLDPEQVPESLRDLVPYAEVWGLGDDVDRDELVEGAPAAAREYSAEYVAFVNMMMAHEYMSVSD